MARIRQTTGPASSNDPLNFNDDPSAQATYKTVDDALLAQTCANFKQLLNNPVKLGQEAGQLIRSTYFPVTELRAALEQTNSPFMRIYYGVLSDEMKGKADLLKADDNRTHFIFMAPADSEGKAIVGADVLLPECIGPNPPCHGTGDSYFTE